ncbi:hypothetical protein LBWT_X1330 (plasmid) [Leptolyngbya boryana IAM M-101]|nr:hypothetical protein LBWT_X1330 [Leptolyngbya boryana IAM M-101]BAS66409.1 hypothetical protein LBDG_X1330 [Leptolyngbya boryana dg5]
MTSNTLCAAVVRLRFAAVIPIRTSSMRRSTNADNSSSLFLKY